MKIENKTNKQIALQKKIIIELNKRPQMPIWILAWIIWEDLYETQILVNDLEYIWAILTRITKNSLLEFEANVISWLQTILLEKIREKWSRMSVWEIEDLLESSMERRKIVEDNWNENEKEKQKNKKADDYINRLLGN